MKSRNRRILHQPFFPIQWTPPPPAPPAPPLVFPNSTVSPSSSSSPTSHHLSSTLKTALIIASASLAVLFILSLLLVFFLLHRQRTQLAENKDKKVEGSEILYLESDGSEVALEMNNPSPEIRPLPPLPRQVLVEDHDKPASDEEMQFFTPNRSLEKSNSWSHACSRTPANTRGNVEDGIENHHRKGVLKRPLSFDKGNTWGRFKSRSFELDEETIERMFVKDSNAYSGKEKKARENAAKSKQEKRVVLEPEKSESIEILLRALNVTTKDICEALLEGNSEFLGTEFLDNLIKLGPTKKEELLLREYNDDISRLTSAERFLKAILDVPFTFKRIDVMLYRANFQTEIDYLKRSFRIIQEALEDLRSNKLFENIIEKITSTKDETNIKIFKLDTLLSLCNIKDEDGKTTLLHFTVQDFIQGMEKSNRTKKDQPDIVREEECKKKGLKTISSLSVDLENVKSAAELDLYKLRDRVKKQELGLEKVKWLLQLDKACDVGEKFFKTMKEFANKAEMEIENVKEEGKRVMKGLREIVVYFDGDLAKEEANPMRIFVLVKDFLGLLDDVCRDLGRIQDRTLVGSRSGRLLHFSPSLIDRRNS